MRPTTLLINNKSDAKPEDAPAPAVAVPPGWSAVLVPNAAANQELGTRGHSEGQIGQDKLVQAILGCKRQGFYLDLAANDAVKYSNTLMLERDYGWNGVCLEANPQYMLHLTDRKCKVVLAAVGDGSEVTFVFTGVKGGIVSEAFDNVPKKAEGETTVKMTTTPLRQILKDVEAPTTIDYMSLDVEGAETLVMQEFPFDTHKIMVLTVERPKQELKDLLASQGYRWIYTAELFDDEAWVHEDIYESVTKTMDWQMWSQPTDDEFQNSCPGLDA